MTNKEIKEMTIPQRKMYAKVCQINLESGIKEVQKTGKKPTKTEFKKLWKLSGELKRALYE